MTTLREHLEAIRDRHVDANRMDGVPHSCRYCGRRLPCAEYVDAVAALDLLDAARAVSTPWYSPWYSLLEGPHRLVPDPEPSAGGAWRECRLHVLRRRRHRPRP